MTKKFYTDVRQVGNRLFVREVVDGRVVDKKVDFSPTLYVRHTEQSQFKDIYGNALRAISFEDINAAKQYVKNHEEIDNYPIYGNTQYQYQYIAQNYTGVIDFDMSALRIYTIDIETATENGFPDIDSASEEVLLISVMNFHTKEIVSYGSRPIDDEKLQELNKKHLKNYDKFTYVLCDNERELLTTFLRDWSSTGIHIVTGWNIQFFDIPYLVHRINKILGDEFSKMLSPWRMLRDKDIEVKGQINRTYELYGIAVVDYLDAYKKFSFSGTQDSYKLDNIAEVELGRKKLENPHETFRDFYTKDWDLFVAYNAVDSEIVDELEDEKKLLELVVTMAYDAKCNFGDVFSAVRTWETILFNHLADDGIIIPRKSRNVGRRIEGAYVQETDPIAFDWVVSFDAASLYPSIIMQLNMSPETITPHMVAGVTVESMLRRESDFSECHDKNLAVAANGHTFTRTKKGIFPQVTETLFAKRKIAKKKMIEAKQQYEATKNTEFKRIASIENSKQMAAKILLNSLYGASASPFFMFYDDRIAEGITLTGQFIIRDVGEKVDEYLNKVCGTKTTFTKYRDTDSLYLSLSPLIDKFYSHKTKLEIVDIIDKISKTKLHDCLEAACAGIAEYTNAFENKLDFKREAIADRALWTGKKRYAANVYDNEGVRYDPPILKVTGLQTVQSTTPKVVRELLKEAVTICLTKTEADLQTFVEHAETIFMAQPAEKIPFTKSVNNLLKYSSPDTIYIKGCPIQVRAALMHNYAIHKNGLGKVREKIKEGEKIKYIYLKTPNPIRENIIGFVGTLPVEFGLQKYVDKTLMFDKLFLEPLENILKALNWTTSPVATLDDLF